MVPYLLLSAYITSRIPQVFMSVARICRRALLTTARIRPTTTTIFSFATPTTRIASPIYTNTTQISSKRFFSATMGKEGVHNLSSYVATHLTSKLGMRRANYPTNRKADFESALSEKGLMVLDCFATWCGPCKVIAPQVVKYVAVPLLPLPSTSLTCSAHRFSNTYESTRFYKIDVDELPEVAQDLSVRAMPTFILFKDGEKVGEVVGANPNALEAAIKQHA
jgi:thioredoxin 1